MRIRLFFIALFFLSVSQLGFADCDRVLDRVQCASRSVTTCQLCQPGSVLMGTLIVDTYHPPL